MTRWTEAAYKPSGFRVLTNTRFSLHHGIFVNLLISIWWSISFDVSRKLIFSLNLVLVVFHYLLVVNIKCVGLLTNNDKQRWSYQVMPSHTHLHTLAHIRKMRENMFSNNFVLLPSMQCTEYWTCMTNTVFVCVHVGFCMRGASCLYWICSYLISANTIIWASSRLPVIQTG